MMDFGAAPTGASCRLRPAAYAIIRDETGRVAVVRATIAKGTFCWLPGGGMESGETCVETVRREVHEELGRRVRLTRLIGQPIQFFHAGDVDCWYEMRATFVRAAFDGEPTRDGDYELGWIDPERDRPLFFHECHAWAASHALADT